MPVFAGGLRCGGFGLIVKIATILAVFLMIGTTFSGCIGDVLRTNGAENPNSEALEWKEVARFASGFRETDMINENLSKTGELSFFVRSGAEKLEVVVEVAFEKAVIDGYLSPVSNAYSLTDYLEPTSSIMLARGNVTLALADPSNKIVKTLNYNTLSLDGVPEMIFPRVFSDVINIENPSEGKWTLFIDAKGVGRYQLVANSYQPAEKKDFLALPYDVYANKVKGAFVGQMAGVPYGYPYEFRSKEIIEIPLWPWIPPIMLDALNQDDIYVEMTFLKSIIDYGINVSQDQAARDFGNSSYQLWHANLAARDCIRNGIMPPYSGHPNYNQHADDIDFQIEADTFGLITPGMPRATYDFCDRFGHIMNYGDGIYGGLFIANMYSKAFFESDPVKVVEYGLSSLPEGSYYKEAIGEVLECYYKDQYDWRAAWDVATKWDTWEKCPDQIGIKASVNGAYVVIALLYSHGDIWKAMEIATRCGHDCDCNPASACGILGTIIGYDKLPDDMKACLPVMDGQKFSYTDYDWKGACDAMCKVGLEVTLDQGGKVDNGMIYVLPQEVPNLGLERWDNGPKYFEVPLDFVTNYPPRTEPPAQ
ncbi:MAG: ADP-ribosylglycohydrolase family protein [Candidatus Thermoplasmatota archaeon]|nr:ADP-ribosylglycohydrolase family protein [Candidatus Thermoplasmatota archaeon]